MRGRPTTQAAFAILRAFVARWYANVLQLHMRLEVELYQPRSPAGCPASESSGAKVHVSLASQPYFSAYAHARAKVGGGREGKIRLGTPARFSWLQLKILS